MNRPKLNLPRHAFRGALTASLVFLSMRGSAFTRPAAPRPVDTRTYIVDGVYRTLSPEGNVLSETPPPPDGPGRLVAAISPAQIVYSDPESGQVLGSSRFIGMTWIFGGKWRQYKAADGSVDLVDTSANIRKVAKRPDGNYAATEMKEIQEDEGVGQATESYIRPLWATRKIPVFSFPKIEMPNDTELFRLRLSQGEQGGAAAGQAGMSDGRGFSPPSFPTPQTPGGQGGGAQPPRRQLSPAEKQLISSDIDMQISQLENQLKQLELDRIRAEGDLQRAIAINVGVITAQARVTQIIQQINRIQFQLTMLQQQRMMLMSQP